MVGLASSFLAHRPAEAVLRAGPTLDEALARLVAAGRDAWPQVVLETERFVAHLARVLPVGASLEDLLRLRAAELHLTCAAAAGSAAAIKALEAGYLSRLDGALRRAGATPATMDEAKQRLRESLLVQRNQGPARIAQYGGRGDLLSWLRISAVREAFKVYRAEPETASLFDDTALSTLGAADAEVQTVLRLHRDDFVQALRQAIAALDPEDRMLLDRHHLQNQSIDVLAAALGIHRATVARRLERAREALGRAVRRDFAQRFGLGKRSCDSLVGALAERMDVTLGALGR